MIRPFWNRLASGVSCHSFARSHKAFLLGHGFSLPSIGIRAASRFTERAGEVKFLLENAKYNSTVVTASADFLMKDGLGKFISYNIANFDVLRKAGAQPGNLVVCRHYKHFVYFLVTRNKWFEHGSYRHLWDALLALRTHCDQNAVKDLLMGRLGDEDNFEWGKVRTLISRIFADSDRNFTIYSQTSHEDELLGTYDDIMDVSKNQIIQGTRVY